MKTFRLVASALAALLVLTACGKRETPVEAGIRTQTLIVGTTDEPGSLDPHLFEWILAEQRILMALCEGLTAFDEQTARLVPALAERWEVSPDGLVYTFHLRPSARWSNGDPVTAADFAFAFQRLLNPKLGAIIAGSLFPLKNAEAFCTGKITDFSSVGVAVVDAHTLRLFLERPTLLLPAMVACPPWLPLHRATLEKFGAVESRSAPWARPGSFVGNGPFTLAEWRADARIVVKRNPLYWDAARIRLEQIVFLRSSREVEEANFRSGQTHVTSGLPPERIASYRQQGSTRLRLEPVLASRFIRFNVTKAPCDKQKVRRALSLAIDRAGMVRAVMADVWRPAEHLTPPDCGGYTARARVPTDFAAARQLLTEAGFPAGRGLPAIEIQVPQSSLTQRVGEVIQETWRRELGVISTIALTELKVLVRNMQTLNYSVGIVGFTGDFVDPSTFLEVFLAKSGDNQTGWANPEYDRLIVEAARTLNPEQRLELFQQAEAILLEEAPLAPLYFDTEAYLIHPAVKGWVPAPLWVRRYQHVWLEK